MSNLRRFRTPFAALVLLAAVASAAAAPKPPAKPAEIDVEVSPHAVAPGQSATVTVRLEPIDGVRINRYPQITLKVADHDGLIGAGQAAVGNTAPPPPDEMETNYFDTVEPVSVDLQVNESAPPGKHKATGELKYFYCVKASGFCAPKKASVEIPFEVR